MTLPQRIRDVSLMVIFAYLAGVVIEYIPGISVKKSDSGLNLVRTFIDFWFIIGSVFLLLYTSLYWLTLPKNQNIKTWILAQGVKFWIYVFGVIAFIAFATIYKTALLIPIEIFVQLPQRLLQIFATLNGNGIPMVFSLIFILASILFWFAISYHNVGLPAEERMEIIQNLVKKNALHLSAALLVSGILISIITFSAPSSRVLEAKWFDTEIGKSPASAQLKLGLLYESGKVVKKDVAKAVKSYTEAAEKGNKYAQYLLGAAYYHSGNGMDKDIIAAKEWFTKSAEQGYVEAQRKLGDIYSIGYCEGGAYGNSPKCFIARDGNEALYWYQKAADQGDELAIKELKKLDMILDGPIIVLPPEYKK